MTRETPFTCDECGKSFERACGLWQHAKIHIPKDPSKGEAMRFKCDQCEFTSLRAGVIINHKVTHENEKLDCPEEDCGFSFKDPYKLIRHRTYKHGYSIHAPNREVEVIQSAEEVHPISTLNALDLLSPSPAPQRLEIQDLPNPTGRRLRIEDLLNPEQASGSD